MNPAKYIGRDEATNRIEDAFADFLTVQWSNLEAINIREEKRHITEDEELSTIRVGKFCRQEQGDDVRSLYATDGFTGISGQPLRRGGNGNK